MLNHYSFTHATHLIFTVDYQTDYHWEIRNDCWFIERPNEYKCSYITKSSKDSLIETDDGVGREKIFIN